MVLVTHHLWTNGNQISWLSTSALACAYLQGTAIVLTYCTVACNVLQFIAATCTLLTKLDLALVTLSGCSLPGRRGLIWQLASLLWLANLASRLLNALLWDASSIMSSVIIIIYHMFDISHLIWNPTTVVQDTLALYNYIDWGFQVGWQI